MTSDEIAQNLSIGMIVGGSGSGTAIWQAAVGAAMRNVARLREGVTSDIRVNVEFHVPGDLLTPEFTGVRTGRFRKADSLLKVQVALPPEPPQQPEVAVIEYLSLALDEVDAWAVRTKRNVDTSSLRSVVAALPSGP